MAEPRLPFLPIVFAGGVHVATPAERDRLLASAKNWMLHLADDFVRLSEQLEAGEMAEALATLASFESGIGHLQANVREHQADESPSGVWGVLGLEDDSNPEWDERIPFVLVEPEPSA